MPKLGFFSKYKPGYYAAPPLFANFKSHIPINHSSQDDDVSDLPPPPAARKDATQMVTAKDHNVDDESPVDGSDGKVDEAEEKL